MRPGKPEGWWGCYPLTSPPTSQKNVHELITLSSNNYYKASYYPLQLGHTILSLLWPLLTDKAIFLIAKLDLNWNSLFKLLIDKFRHTLKKVGKTTRPFRYDLNQISYDYTVVVRNRSKGLDLIDRVPDELWWRFLTLYMRQGSRLSPRKRNAKKQNGCLRRPYK